MENTQEVFVDELDEDPPISSQKKVVVSYAFSNVKDKEGKDTLLPMIKIRGSYPDWDACDRRIRTLDNASKDPKNIPLLKTEVGKWIGLYPYEDLYSNTDIDVEYKNDIMNEAMKGLKEAEKRSEDKFQERLKEQTAKTTFDGTKEGQEILLGEKENVYSVYSRYSQFKEEYESYRRKLEEVLGLYTAAKEKLFSEYTEEERTEAINKITETVSSLQLKS